MKPQGLPRETSITPPGLVHEGLPCMKGCRPSSRAPACGLVQQILPGPRAPAHWAQAWPVITQVTRSQSTG